MLPMQQAFDFMGQDLGFVRTALARSQGPLGSVVGRPPIWQLARSLIGSQTYDTVADPAFYRLRARWPHPSGIADATSDAVLGVIGDVNYAEAKADHLIETMRIIGSSHPDYDLMFLGGWPLRDALDWLERLPGVGPKVAAATLNASALRMPAFIVDSHVHRVLLRFGFIDSRASAEQGRDVVTASGLDADVLLELFARIKRLGQTVCRHNAPRCEICPLAARCRKDIALGVPPTKQRRGFSGPGVRRPPRHRR